MNSERGVRSWRGRLPLALLLALIAAPRLAGADPNALDAVVGKTIRANYPGLHACYRQALAEDRTRGGTVFIRATMGPLDAVRAAKVVRDKLKHPRAVGCMTASVSGWTLRGAAAAGVVAGSEVVIPLTFRPLPDQFVVRVEDAPTIKVGRDLAARALLTAGSVGAKQASLSTLSINGEAALPHKAGVDQLLYVLLGRGTLKIKPRGRRTKARYQLRAGTAIWLHPDTAARVAGSLELVQIYAPAGLEQAFRKAGRATGQAVPKLTFVQRGMYRTRSLKGGKIKVTPLLASARTGHKRFYLGLLRLAAGVKLPPHAHLEAELVYVLSGKGTVTVGGRTATIGAGFGVHLPAGARHYAAVHKPMLVLQLFAPAGPERKYLRPPRAGSKKR